MKIKPHESSLSFRRTCNRWAMTAYKGGRCSCCGERVTYSTFNNFNFHHKEHLKNPHDLTARWNGPVRDWPPFSPKWIDWAETIDLICKPCHLQEHKKNLQIDIEDYLRVQSRLDDHDPGLPNDAAQADLL